MALCSGFSAGKFHPWEGQPMVRPVSHPGGTPSRRPWTLRHRCPSKGVLLPFSCLLHLPASLTPASSPQPPLGHFSTHPYHQTTSFPLTLPQVLKLIPTRFSHLSQR